jgi:RNA polymerase sigma factor (sigma-70 family)
VAVAAVRIPSRHARLRPVLRAVDDERLVARVRAGDDAAFEAIYDRYSRSLLAFCRHMLGSRDEAEDALQHSFVCAYRTLHNTDCDITLRPWLFAIARNRCLSVLRARREAVDFDEMHSQPPTFDGLAAVVQQRAELRELVEDLQQIPADQRAALVLFELGDRSHNEIASVLDVRCEKVKALIFQAREALRRNRQARDTPCPEIREQLAVLTGKVPRRGMLRAHVDRCPACADFVAEACRQRAALALILPVAPSVGLKGSVLGGGGVAAAGGAGGGAAVAASGGGGAAVAGAGATGLGGGAVAAGGAGVGVTGGLGSVGAGGVAAGLGHAGVGTVATGLAAAGAGAGAASGLAGLAAKGVVAKILTAVAVAGAGASTGGHEPASRAPARPALAQQAATPAIPAPVPLAPAPVATAPAAPLPAPTSAPAPDAHAAPGTKDTVETSSFGDHGLPPTSPAPEAPAPLVPPATTSGTPAASEPPAATSLATPTATTTPSAAPEPTVTPSDATAGPSTTAAPAAPTDAGASQPPATDPSTAVPADTATEPTTTGETTAPAETPPATQVPPASAPATP